MRLDLVEVAAPSLDDDLGVGSRPGSFEAQALIAELAIEALGGTLLPGLARIDQGRFDARAGDPLQRPMQGAPDTIERVFIDDRWDLDLEPLGLRAATAQWARRRAHQTVAPYPYQRRSPIR